MEQLACLRVEQKCAEVNTFVVLQAVTFALPFRDLAEYLKCLEDSATPEKCVSLHQMMWHRALVAKTKIPSRLFSQGTWILRL